MTAETRFAVVVIGSFLVWLPSLAAFLRGDVGASTAGVRYAGALVLVWGALTVLGGIIGGYSTDVDPAGESAGEGEALRRRAGDDDAAPPVPA